MRTDLGAEGRVQVELLEHAHGGEELLVGGDRQPSSPWCASTSPRPSIHTDTLTRLPASRGSSRWRSQRAGERRRPAMRPWPSSHGRAAGSVTGGGVGGRRWSGRGRRRGVGAEAAPRRRRGRLGGERCSRSAAPRARPRAPSSRPATDPSCTGRRAPSGRERGPVPRSVLAGGGGGVVSSARRRRRRLGPARLHDVPGAPEAHRAPRPWRRPRPVAGERVERQAVGGDELGAVGSVDHREDDALGRGRPVGAVGELEGGPGPEAGAGASTGRPASSVSV